MKTRSIALFATLLGLARGVSAADNLSEALQKGLLEEEANHNLDAAIQAYQSAVNQFADQRKIAATAVFRLGECYRKQGRTNEAALQYQRVLADFADQTSLVGASERNLAALGQASGQGEGGQIAVAARTVTDPDQLNLLKEEIRLVEAEIAMAEARLKVGRGGFDEIAKSQKALLELQRQLPENATATAQKSLIDQQIQLVEKLLKEKKKQVEVGAAPPLDTILLERQLLGLKRELIAVSKTPAKAGGNVFDPYLQQFTRDTQLAEETKTIERYKALAQNSPDLLNAKDPQGSTPLHYSAGRGELTVANFLLSNGADVNSRDSQGFTPLHNAVRHDQKPMVELLLAHHADINAKSITPLHLAASKGLLSVAELLLASGADPNAEMSGATIEPLVDDRRRFGNQPPDQEYSAATPLHYAAAGGYLAIVKLLLDHKADVNAKSKGGQTPLFTAVEKGRLEVTKFLLANRANPNVTASSGVTLFGVAVQNQNLDLVKVLLAAGAELNAKGIPLGSFSSSGRSVANLLSPLAFTASAGRTELVELLLKHKADVNSQDGRGDTPLMWASRNGHIKIVRWLLDNGANPNLKNQEGDTPLHLSQSKEIHELLLARKADVNAKNGIGRTPLHNAAGDQGAKELVEVLLSKGADANAVDGNGQTALFLAVMVEDKESVELLIAHGADVKAKDKDGRTPLGYVSTAARVVQTPSGFIYPRRQTATPTQIAEILRKHGAE